ncbi:MAG TPA: LPS export ABC transporter ATP-binding protein [Longimicrobiales bacterium]|nr:LPS export ABC transporter ATP-binding protein [Longimicrobiales bacterium]
MTSSRLETFLDGLRAHDGSVAVAVAELIQRADESGALDRGEWMAAVTQGWDSGVGGAGGDPEERARYLEENVVARLEREGMVTLEPAGETWERVRVAPDMWRDIEPARAATSERVRDRIRLLERVEQAPATAAERNGGSHLAARSLTKVYRRRKVVNEVDVTVRQGEIVGLLGPNGAGKTTTFYMMVGLISPTDGKVFLDDDDLTTVPMYRRARRGIGYLAQEPSVFRKLSVEQNIRAILETMPLDRKARKERLETLLDELSIKHLRSAKAYSLSGGERRRLEITRALVSNPKFMLLDEPFAGVDPIAVHDIQQIVASLRHRGIGVIISDHNVEQTLDIVDRAYIMYDGRVRVAGTVAELVWNDEVAEIYFGPTLTARMRERYRRPEVA